MPARACEVKAQTTPISRRRVALSVIVCAAASMAVVASAQLAVGWQGATSSVVLLNLGYAAQFAGMVQVLAIPLARAGKHLTGLALASFVAGMFLPMMYGHAARHDILSDLYLVNVLLVLVLAVATTRAAAAACRGASA
ncbi:hypothetical protein [Rhodococcus triatomae]